MPRLKHKFISERIDALQLRRWWLAEQLGINRRTLQRWLSGATSSVPQPALDQLAELLNCEVVELVQPATVASNEEQLQAAKALVASDLLTTMTPGHQFALYTQLAKGMIVEGLEKRELGELYMNLALALFRQAQLDEAGDYASRVKDIALDIDDERLLLRANMQLSYQAYLKGDAAECLVLDEENLKLAEQLDEPKLIAANLSNLGDQHFTFGRYEESIDYQQQAIARYEAIGPGVESNLTFCFLGLTGVYLEQDNVELAQMKLDQAKLWAQQGNFVRGLADVLRYQGLLYSLRGRLSQALEFAEASRQSYQKLGVVEVPVLIDLGLIYWRCADQRAESTLHQALELARQKTSCLLEAFVRKAMVESQIGDVSEHRGRAKEVFAQAGLAHQIQRMG